MVVQMRKPLVSLLSGLHAPKYQPTFADNTNIHQNYRYVTINLADPHVSFMVVPNICGMWVYSKSPAVRPPDGRACTHRRAGIARAGLYEHEGRKPENANTDCDGGSCVSSGAIDFYI